MAGGNVPGNLAPIFNAAGAAYGIPPAVLAGISSVESNFNFGRGEVSSAGALGGMQFEPGTARSLGVNPWDPRSAIFGTAKYLAQLGYRQNPMRAIGAYNGGPGNPQYGYAQQVMSEAHRLGGELGGGRALGGTGFGSMQVPVTSQSFNGAAFGAARDRFIAGSLLQSEQPLGGPKADVGTSPLFSKGLLSTSAPNPQDYLQAHTSLVDLSGVPLQMSPQLRAGTIAGGFLPKNAKYIPGRKDQGRDGQTNPGAPMIANGHGRVVAVLSDPNGFGPRYPVVRFDSGPYAGKDIYFGHTLAAVQQGQQVQPGQVISYTGRQPVGNASVPGWFEVGYAPGGSPGPFGQPTPF